MKTVKISVTAAARNFADCVKRARYQNMTFILLKNGSPVARLTSEHRDNICTGRRLAKVLAKIELPKSEGKAWHRDLMAARRTVTPR